MDLEPLRIVEGVGLDVLDQTLLPGETRRLTLRTLDEVCEGIASLRVRGAPLLGIVGAAGMAIAAETADASDVSLHAAWEQLSSTRPTALELSSLSRRALEAALAAGNNPSARRKALWKFASEHAARRVAEDRRLAEAGVPLIQSGSSVLTHCNTGALATGGIGTALGVIRVAWERGLVKRCYATETRPLLQGARLTMWELAALGIPATLVPDTAAASLVASGRVQAVITGADRIAANGDTANKVGTYALALAAARHSLPFYIAAPVSTVDLSCGTGAGIPIEFRADAEVRGFRETMWSPPGVQTYNPAFDVTPADLITAIITEAGVLRPPSESSVRSVFAERQAD